MMEFFQVAGKLLMLPSGIMLAYDLCYFWFVKNQLKVQTTMEWITKLVPGLKTDAHLFFLKLGANGAKIEALPGFAVFLIPGLVCYLLYRMIFLLQGGKAGGYKSRH